MTLKTALMTRLIQVMGNSFAKPVKELRFEDVEKKTEKKKIPTSEGDVWVTIYFPQNVDESSKAPVYVNFHGGGFIMRNPDSDDHICRYIADKAGCFVVNVDYDVAPQKPFPVAPVQSYEVVKWVMSNDSDFAWDSSNLAIGGQSAGGNLAAGVCISCIKNATQLPKLQILFYPPLDLATPPENKTSSIEKPMINAQISNLFNAAYVPDLIDRKHPLASPLLADKFSEHPQTLVITAAHDLLCKEGKAYAESLSNAGVEVEYREIENVDHAFTHTGPVVEAKESIDFVAKVLSETFSR